MVSLSFVLCSAHKAKAATQHSAILVCQVFLTTQNSGADLARGVFFCFPEECQDFRRRAHVGIKIE